MTKKSKIGICHYRIGKTDGVSLEIMKRKQVLEEMGYTVKLISGPRQIGADFVIPELEFDRPDIVKIKKNAFFKFKDYSCEDDLMADIYRLADSIRESFLKIQKKEKFDYLFLHNIFSHGRHIAGAKAFSDIINEANIKVIAVSHDFYESYEGLYVPRTLKIKKYLKSYVPPKSKSIKHVTINSLSQALLYKKIKRKSIIFPDTFKFNQKPWSIDSYNKDFLKTFGLKEKDLIIFQGTRIVERKAIELAIDLIAELNKRKDELIGKKLWNGKVFTKDSNIVLAYGQFVEPASKQYKTKLIAKMRKQGVKYKFMSSCIGHERVAEKGKKSYSLWDAYVYADLISYPSTWEGFGNQFLEAVFARKPIFVFEYPVFKADIKKEGYDYISLGSNFKRVNKMATISKNKLRQATNEIIKVLLNSKTKQTVNKNFQIGKKYHGEKALKRLLKQCLK